MSLEAGSPISEVQRSVTALESIGRTLDNWILICAIGVAIFLAAEVVFSVLHWRSERQLRPLQEERDRLHATELETLRTAAEEAKAKAVEAQLALEKYKAPRTLTGEQIQTLIEELRPFTGQAYDLSLPKMLEPGAGLDTQLVAVLHKAGWKVQQYRGSGPKGIADPAIAIFSMDLPTTEGTHNISIPQIQIGISEGLVGVLVGFEQGDQLDAHGALLQALFKVGIDARLFPLDRPIKLGAISPRPGPATVHLIIGQKN
jgi:hypothetical protein